MTKKQAVPFVNHCDQGELHFRVAKIPASAKPRKDVGDVVVGHSETGHHHSFSKACGVTYYETANPLIGYLSISQESLLEHHRSYDDHAAYVFPPGTYEVRKRREYVSPEETRAVAD